MGTTQSIGFSISLAEGVGETKRMNRVTVKTKTSHEHRHRFFDSNVRFQLWLHKGY